MGLRSSASSIASKRTPEGPLCYRLVYLRSRSSQCSSVKLQKHTIKVGQEVEQGEHCERC